MRRFFATKFDTACTITGTLFILFAFALAMRLFGPEEFGKDLQEIPIAHLVILTVLSAIVLLKLGYIKKSKKTAK